MDSSVLDASTSPSLVRSAMDGSSWAWHQLAFLYSPLVAHWARQMNVAPSDQTDIVQEVFQGLVKTSDAMDLDRGFRGWLYGITRHKVQQYFRRQSQIETRSLDGLPLELVADRGTQGDGESRSDGVIDPAQDRVEQRWLLRRALDVIAQSVEDRSMQMFRELMFDGFDTAEVASRFGVQKSTVRQNRCRMIRRLKHLVGNDLPPLHSEPIAKASDD